MYRRGGFLIIVALVATTLALPAGSQAAVTTVNCNNVVNDVTAIQNAVNTSSSGDTITIRGTCDFSDARPAGGDHASIQNAGVVIKPGAPINGLTITSADNPLDAQIVGTGNENAFFIAPGNSNIQIRGLRFVRLGRPIVVVNASDVLIGDSTDGTTPERWGNRIAGEFGMSSAILAVGRDRGFNDAAGTLTIKYGNNAATTATFGIPPGQKLERFSAVGNFITHSDPGLPAGDPNDIIAIDVRQADLGEVRTVDIIHNATGFLTDDIPSFGWNAVRVQAHANTAAYHVFDVDVIQNNFGMLEELTPPSNDPNKAGRAGVLLVRVDGFNVSSNKVRALMTPTVQPTLGGGIVMSDSSNGEVALNATIVIAQPTTPVTSDLGAYGVVDDLFFGSGGGAGGPPSEHIVLRDNTVGPLVGPPVVGGLHGFVVTGSTDITVKGNTVRTSTSHAIEVAGRVEGPSATLPKRVIGSLFCGNVLDGRPDDPQEVGFEEDGLAGSYANSLPDGTSRAFNGNCVAAGAILTLTGPDTQVSEAGAFDTYKLRLTLRPSSPVTVTLSGNTQLTTSPVSLTFDYTNWIFDQVVTVNAIDDAIFEGTHSGFVSHVVVSTDPLYASITIQNVDVIIFDNDPGPPPTTKQIIVTESGGSTDVVEGGASDTYTIVLSAAPNTGTTVQVNVFPNAQVTRVPTSGLIFNGSNWMNPQTIIVSAVDDTVFEGPHTGFIDHASFSGDPAYNAAPIPGVLVHITDNDFPDLTPPPPPVINGASCTSPVLNKRLTLNGTAEAGSIVTIYLNGSPFVQTPAPAGSWSVTLIFTANGTYEIKATATDAAGNESGFSAACTVVVASDFTPPGPPVILVPVEGAFVGVPTIISGTADLDSVTVDVFENSLLLGTSTVTSGNWAISVNLAEGAHSVKAKAYDSLDVTVRNASAFSPSRNFFVDRTPPTITITRPFGYLGFQLFIGGVHLEGKARDNIAVHHVTVTYTNLLTGAVTTSAAVCTLNCGTGSIEWADDPSPLGLVGIYAVRARAFDNAGLGSAFATETVIALFS